MEVFITSSTGDQISSATIWNGETLTQLTTYRGINVIPPHCLDVKEGYVIASEKGKPILRSWPLNKQQFDHKRLTVPGKVNALNVSNNFSHIAIGVGEKLHIYQACSGRLIGIGLRHFQPIVVLQFDAFGTTIACGGEDGLITIWSLEDFYEKLKNPEPVFTFTEHTLPITDMIMSNGDGRKARLFSVSADRTCKVFELNTGTLLLSVIFDVRLTAISLLTIETELFIGNGDGKIYQISLRSPPRNLEYHVSNEKSPEFIGHTKSVTTLSCSVDCCRLLSGSNDETIRLWHIASRQCLKILNVKGSVTNAFFVRVPSDFALPQFKPKIILENFDRSIDKDEESEYCLNILTQTNDLINDKEMKILSNYKNFTSNCSSNNNIKLEEEIRKLKCINSQLYQFAMMNILQHSHKDEDAIKSDNES